MIYKLRATSSTLTKQVMLESSDTYDKAMFKAAYNQNWTYGLTFSDDEIDMYHIDSMCDADLALLERLKTRELSGNAARDAVMRHCSFNGDLVKLICNRDLKCGVTATTVNKVFPGLIPQFKVQLAKEVPLEDLKYPLYAQLTYDGVRGIVMLDTEITLEGGTTEDRTTVSGMLNSARQGKAINESVLRFNVFDALPLAEFNNQTCSMPYDKRLTMAIIECADLGPPFWPAESRLVHSIEEANELFNTYLSLGQEGLILKPINHKYTFKRSKDWVKVKAIKDCDLSCVAIELGTGKYQSMIGALVCEGIVEGTKVTVRVGTGLTDKERASDPSFFVGSTVEVIYNSLIQDSVTKAWSLFLPRFNMVRFDR